jgi:hypothetical protein
MLIRLTVERGHTLLIASLPFARVILPKFIIHHLDTRMRGKLFGIEYIMRQGECYFAFSVIFSSLEFVFNTQVSSAFVIITLDTRRRGQTDKKSNEIEIGSPI